jgi:hypothetical protein
MDLRYDIPDDAAGGQYALHIEFNETSFVFSVLDASNSAAEEGEPEWTEIGAWRQASLWMARQLLALGSPVAFGTSEEIVQGPHDGAHQFTPSEFPSREARALSDVAVLALLNDPEG